MKVRNLKSACWVMPALGFKVGGVSFFRGIKIAKGDGLAVKVYGRAPFPVVGVNTHVAACGPAFTPIMDIPLACYCAKVAKSVIVADTIDMVNFISGPSAMNVQPCKSVGGIGFPINLDANVSVSVYCPSLSPMQKGFCGGFPHKNAGFSVVIQKITQAFCGKIGLSHIVAPVKRWFGQRPGIAVNFAGLRYYSMELA